MTYETITLVSRHGYVPGDVVRLGGAMHVVVARSDYTITVRKLGLLHRMWLWLRGLLNLRGFWSRVWDR